MSDLPRLPFAFSRGQGVLLGGADDQGVELLLRPGASPAAVAEVRRQVGRPLRLVEVDAETFGRQLAERYGSSFDGQRTFNKKEEVEDGPQLKLAPFMDEAKRE